MTPEDRAAFDRTTGKSVAISTFDTQTHAQFSREALGELLARVVATGWQPEPAEFYEVVEERTRLTQ